ncbi:MAG: hypothetical protein ABIH34_06605 [Nanoarchaeota archaeon]
MILKNGIYTLETFAKERSLTRQSALNLLSKLKKEGHVQVSGGGRQKRLYKVSSQRKAKTNGFYDLVNKYSPEKLHPAFEHYTHGRYTVEQAIIDGIKIGDARTLEATLYLFNHVTNWRTLFCIAKKEKITYQLCELYQGAREQTRTRRMPKRYKK